MLVDIFAAIGLMFLSTMSMFIIVFVTIGIEEGRFKEFAMWWWLGTSLVIFVTLFVLSLYEMGWV